MDFDEQGDSGFPVALSAPARLDVTERDIDGPLTSSSTPRTEARMQAPGRARTDVDWAVMVFSLHWTQTLAARSAAPPSSSSTIH
jgi:hypothetical protein